jgi:hypothetical protein
MQSLTTQKEYKAALEALSRLLLKDHDNISAHETNLIKELGSAILAYEEIYRPSATSEIHSPTSASECPAHTDERLRMLANAAERFDEAD